MQSQASAVDDQAGLAPPALPAATEPAPEIVEAERETFSRRLLAGAIFVSCTLHVAGAAAMLSSNSAMPDYGVIAQQTDAISVELTASTILEAVEATASIATAAAAPTATQEGNPVPSTAAAVPMTKVEETPVAEAVKAVEVKPEVARRAAQYRARRGRAVRPDRDQDRRAGERGGAESSPRRRRRPRRRKRSSRSSSSRRRRKFRVA